MSWHLAGTDAVLNWLGSEPSERQDAMLAWLPEFAADPNAFESERNRAGEWFTLVPEIRVVVRYRRTRHLTLDSERRKVLTIERMLTL